MQANYCIKVQILSFYNKFIFSKIIFNEEIIKNNTQLFLNQILNFHHKEINQLFNDHHTLFFIIF